MFSLTLDGIKYKVAFKHDFSVHEVKISDKNLAVKGITICEVSFPEDKKRPSIVGLAFCSEKDNYNRNTGRKISLKNALDILESEKAIPHSDRVNFWNAYFDMRGGRK